MHASNRSSSFERLAVERILGRWSCPNLLSLSLSFGLLCYSLLMASRGSLLMWAVMLLLRIPLILNTPFQLGGSLTFYFHLFTLPIHLLNLVIIRWVL